MAGAVRRWLPRGGQYLLVVLAAFTLNFLLPHLAPGDPVAYFYRGDGGALDAAQLDALRITYGLDGSLPAQYLDYWAGLVTGDLGISVQHNRPVLGVLLDRLPWTLLLVVPAALTSVTVGTVLGAVAARRRGTPTDVGLTTGTLLLDAMPGFWIGMVLIGVFAAELGWLPSFGAVALSGDAGLGYLRGVALRLILPVTTLTLATVGGVFLLARGSMAMTLDQPYVLLAHLKGVASWQITYRHALRNALLPIWTHLSLMLAVLFSGAVVIETVFAYPGLGRLLYDATVARDHPLLRGAFLLLTLGVVGLNLVADLTYPLLDPRVRRPREGARP